MTSIAAVTQIEREGLLDRMGVFGVRLAISLIRLGAAPTASVLAGELSNRSGVNHLRGLLTTVLAERRDVLKARVALAGIDAALSAMPDAGLEPLRVELERIVASSHEFSEVHLLNATRAGALRFRPAEIEELEMLLGSIGAPRHVRLGLRADADRAPGRARRNRPLASPCRKSVDAAGAGRRSTDRGPHLRGLAAGAVTACHPVAR